MHAYERLKAWEQCHFLVLEVYRVTRSWPREETYGLVAQARQAASSAAMNIAEGAAKRGPREFRRYLDIAIGSLAELAYLLRLAEDLQFGAKADRECLVARREEAAKVTWGLYKAIKQSGRAHHPAAP